MVLAQALQPSLAPSVVHATGMNRAAPFTSSRIPIHFSYFPCSLVFQKCFFFFFFPFGVFTRLIGRRSIVVFCHSGQLVTSSALDSRFPILLTLSINRFLSSCPHPTYFSFLIFVHHFFVYTLGNILNWALSLFALFRIPISHSFDILPHIACEFNKSRLYYLTRTPSSSTLILNQYSIYHILDRSRKPCSVVRHSFRHFIAIRNRNRKLESTWPRYIRKKKVAKICTIGYAFRLPR